MRKKRTKLKRLNNSWHKGPGQIFQEIGIENKQNKDKGGAMSSGSKEILKQVRGPRKDTELASGDLAACLPSQWCDCQQMLHPSGPQLHHQYMRRPCEHFK
jgi:hypothetical protein